MLLWYHAKVKRQCCAKPQQAILQYIITKLTVCQHLAIKITVSLPLHIIGYKSTQEEVTDMPHECSMNELNVGESAAVIRLLVHGSMRRRLLDIGLVEGTRVECIGKSPSGDPSAYLIRGAVIAIRSEDCCDILIEKE